MEFLKRITFDPEIMGGKPCIRGMRVTVGMIVGLIASGHNKHEILELYPYLETEDIDEALQYAAWRVEEIEVPVWPEYFSKAHWRVGSFGV
jgi:uncharacterized protein (DUF433 family)